MAAEEDRIVSEMSLTAIDAGASCQEPPRRDILRRDITDRRDLAGLLTDFYGRAFTDDLLGPVFVDVARMNLADHLPVMCDFWLTVLFHSGQYKRNALKPHLQLHTLAQLTPAHFERWLALWVATVDDRHSGDKAEQAKLQATRIAGSMSRRITGEAPAAIVCALARAT